VDLSGSLGQPVLAAHVGSVTYAGRLAGRGVVVVTRGAERTTYEPVDALVEVGDTVTAGQVLGRLELFGSHCWPRACLHWGLLRGERYLDPLTLVGSGPVRLLPLGTGTGAPLAAPALPTAAPGLSLGRVAPWLPGATAGLRSIQAGTPLVTGWPLDAEATAAPPAAPVPPSPAEQPQLASADALHPRTAELSPLRPAGAPAGRPAAAGPW
jgi:hypothetical protein